MHIPQTKTVMENINEKIGLDFMERRLDEDITRSYLSKRTNIKAKRIEKIESGEVESTIDEMTLLSDCLETIILENIKCDESWTHPIA